ncbi:MAG: hypothetical protein GQ544_07815 [Candidatus Aminicenantes bacterium]|nr:hypothetical protein [Candidatus Aminicenantes bacterium]
MKETQCFDALLQFDPSSSTGPSQAWLKLREIRVPVSLHYYPHEETGRSEGAYVQISCSQPIETGWGDIFTLEIQNDSVSQIKGTVLDPASQKITRSKEKKQLEYLGALTGDAKEMFYTLALKKGINGITENDVAEFSSLPEKERIEIAQSLEGEGRIKILAFSPLLIVAQQSFEFLCDRILDFVESGHLEKPEILGILEEKIKERFQLQTKMMVLALKYLEKEKKIIHRQDRVFPSDFKLIASPQEEELLSELEALILKGEFHRIPQDELKIRFHLSDLRMERLLALLTERQKIVQGSDGFLLHSKWLEELIVKIKETGKDELSVADFKELTGLSRKYAIPLLELLDQMGVTLRQGNVRKIL